MKTFEHLIPKAVDPQALLDAWERHSGNTTRYIVTPNQLAKLVSLSGELGEPADGDEPLILSDDANDAPQEMPDPDQFISRG